MLEEILVASGMWVTMMEERNRFRAKGIIGDTVHTCRIIQSTSACDNDRTFLHLISMKRESAVSLPDLQNTRTKLRKIDYYPSHYSRCSRPHEWGIPTNNGN